MVKLSKGFTLVEIIIVSLIMSIVTTGIVTFFNVFSSQINFLVRTSQMEDASHNVLNNIMEDVMESYDFEIKEINNSFELIIIGKSSTETIRYKSFKQGSMSILQYSEDEGSNWKNYNTYSENIGLDCQFVSEKKNHVSIDIVVQYLSNETVVSTRSISRDVFCRNSAS